MKTKKSLCILGLFVISGSIFGITESCQNKQEKFYTVPLAGNPYPTIRDAVGIHNGLDNNLSYFYTNLKNNGQPRWYEHSVKNNSNTWDWTWSDATTYNGIEFELQLDKNTNFFATIVFNSFTDGGRIYYESLYFTQQDSNIKNNPDWANDIWTKRSTTVENYYQLNQHSKIDFYYKKVNDKLEKHLNWNDLDIIIQ